MKKNFLISTGGSGGHVIPATILYEHLSKEKNVFLTSDRRGLNFLDQNKYQIKIIDTPRLNNIFFLPFNFLIIIFLTLKSIFLLKNIKITKIFSTGGYMSIPIILAAKILNLEIFLLEPNQVLGRANKFFLSSCIRIFCYSNSIKNFPSNYKRKITIIYPLVKKKIYDIKTFNQEQKKFTILIVGGSQGANIFDNNLKTFIRNISKIAPIKIIQQTNHTNVETLRKFYLKNNIESQIFTFDNNFVNILSQTDLCITRAGASTLAELSVLNIPFIAIPLPSAKDKHQFKNANFYKEYNCCWLIDQSSFEEKIEKLLNEIINDKRDYLIKKENLKKLNFQNTWEKVNQKILRVINENRTG